MHEILPQYKLPHAQYIKPKSKVFFSFVQVSHSLIFKTYNAISRSVRLFLETNKHLKIFNRLYGIQAIHVSFYNNTDMREMFQSLKLREQAAFLNLISQGI